jgi:hypothetical protein
MEEILASIRKIISEDQAEPEKSGAAATAPGQGEILELTNELQDDGAVAPVAMEAVEPEAAPLREVPRYNAMSAGREGPEMSHDELISENARQALGQAFDALDHGQTRTIEEQTMTAGTLDAAFERAVRSAFEPVLHDWVDSRADQVMEQLKPLIRQWMDDNLPALIENAVRNEIARAVRSRRR